MNCFILSAGIFDATKNEVSELLNQSDFRRTTHNMQMAYLAAKHCLSSVAEPMAMIKSRCALIVGTSHGELAATADFLGEFHKSKTARPLLFQSSLHNATLGFLSKVLELPAVGLTVSDGYFSGERALIEAQVLIAAGMVDCALVIGVDGLVPRLQSALESMYETTPLLTEGAAAILLGGETARTQLPQLNFDRRLGEVSTFTKNKTSQFDCSTPYYDSNAIECLAKAFRTSPNLILNKPDGSYSVLATETL